MMEIEKPDEIQEKLRSLENRIEMLEILAKKQTQENSESQEMETRLKKVIQINADGKRFFCTTPQEQQIFIENNPGVRMETFNIELLEYTANEYLNDPENKKQFERQGVTV